MASPVLRLARRLCTLPNKQVQDVSAMVPDPLQSKDFFGVQKLFTVKDLFDARVHMGHKEGTLNDHMRPYLFGSRLGHLIFDLDQTAELLGDALNFLAHMAYRDGVILFLSRHRQTSFLVEQMAVKSGEYAHTRQWKTANMAMLEEKALPLPDLMVFLHTQDTVFAQHQGVVDAAQMLIPTVNTLFGSPKQQRLVGSRDDLKEDIKEWAATYV